LSTAAQICIWWIVQSAAAILMVNGSNYSATREARCDSALGQVLRSIENNSLLAEIKAWSESGLFNGNLYHQNFAIGVSQIDKI
jgi:hypothetical protein